eukprot:gnl/TRDRNA2_/TRDRNA2_55131_c0_seq1.p1 gnl/TRDRNA2_/TRDRNA2_55131_c0~~gnl/TRDRNA2_/TRDRNA2_55131_c0_seq1.p1  ORF type:complete len:213 (+),score=43.99 gnl/TRDRNA2_/TRDRNA2_55131_c0_seq1:32-640(+)
MAGDIPFSNGTTGKAWEALKDPAEAAEKEAHVLKDYCVPEVVTLTGSQLHSMEAASKRDTLTVMEAAAGDIGDAQSRLDQLRTENEELKQSERRLREEIRELKAVSQMNERSEPETGANMQRLLVQLQNETQELKRLLDEKQATDADALENAERVQRAVAQLNMQKENEGLAHSQIRLHQATLPVGLLEDHGMRAPARLLLD